MATKLNIATKSDFVSRPSVPTNQKQNASEFNSIVSAINGNYERLVLDWSTDIVANSTLAVGQKVLFTDGVLYRITTAYNVGNPITWNVSNAEAVSTIIPFGATSGTNTYTITLSPAITAYTNGMKIHVKVKDASTGASTLNANTVGAKKIFINPTTQAGNGDLVDEQEYIMSYDSALDAAAGGWLIIGSGAAGYTAENVANKATDFSTINDTLYPSIEAVNDKLRSTRAVTGADAIVQTDDNSVIIFNSATPFNFTLDQLTASSKISFINIGAGAVTFINGTGVTLVGTPTLHGSTGTDYPTALVFYISATSPRIVVGTNKIDLNTVSTAGGTITLDCNNQVERMFIGSASFSSAKTIALSNDTNALVINFVFTITNVAGTLDFPSTFTMQSSDSRWTDASHRFTPGSTGKHEFSATWDGTDWNMKVTNPYS